jgi:hypothetical protein
VSRTGYLVGVIRTVTLGVTVASFSMVCLALGAVFSGLDVWDFTTGEAYASFVGVIWVVTLGMVAVPAYYAIRSRSLQTRASGVDDKTRNKTLKGKQD